MNFICEECSYCTSIKANYNKHLTTSSHLYKVTKITKEEFKCSHCNYSTNIKCNYEKHLKTSSHQLMMDKDAKDNELVIHKEISELKIRIGHYEGQRKLLLEQSNKLLEQNDKLLDLLEERDKLNVSNTYIHNNIFNISIENNPQQNYSDKIE